MSSTRIYHNISKIPITSTLVLIFGNYELWRIHKGIHPYWTPKLEAAGIVTRRHKTLSEPSDNRAVATRVEPSGEESEAAIRWTNLNGIPIPTLEALMRPFRKD
ncbi:Nn.00g115760.m01.CDS01 [Neocucurbitaria sp. VM-36]